MVELYFIRRVIVLFVVMTLQANAGVQNAKRELKDLQYGEVLFHFYQEDYFFAISHLMTAKEKNEFIHQSDEAALLLGGLQLSYGMRHHAEKQFQDVLDSTADKKTRNNAWYQIGKAAYQQNDLTHTLLALEKIEPVDDKSQLNEVALLKANVQMKQLDNEAATRTLKEASNNSPLLPYLKVNQGIALLRQGNVEDGRNLLDRFISQNAATEEDKTLRDKASLALGYQLLKDGQANDALHYLNNIRLDGSMSNAALLGAGWANLQTGRYEDALTPWFELQGRKHYDAAVQEAHLAIPFAYAKLGDSQRAIHFYEESILFYQSEVELIRIAGKAVESNLFSKVLERLEHPDGSVLREMKYLKGLLAENSFRKDLYTYRDLNDLAMLITQWGGDTAVLRDMVDARRAAYKIRSPAIVEQLDVQQAKQLRVDWDTLQQRVNKQATDPESIDFATSNELEQLQIFKRIEHALAKLPDEPRYIELGQRKKWLNGVLSWNIDSKYKQRVWDAKKILYDIDVSTNEARNRHKNIENLLAAAHKGFEGYGSRIDILQRRLEQLLPKVISFRDIIQNNLQVLALEELGRRESRLSNYLSQARFALARSYDQLSRGSENAP